MGLTRAARMTRRLMVSDAMTRAAIPARAKTHQLTGVR